LGLLWQKRRETDKQVVGFLFLFLLGEQQAIKQASRQQIERSSSSREIHSSSSSSPSEVCGVFLFFLLFSFCPGASLQE
jgi:hypothetical protein